MAKLFYGEELLHVFPVYVGHAYGLDARLKSKHIRVSVPFWLPSLSPTSSKPSRVPLGKHISASPNPHLLVNTHMILDHGESISMSLCKNTWPDPFPV